MPKHVPEGSDALPGNIWESCLLAIRDAAARFRDDLEASFDRALRPHVSGERCSIETGHHLVYVVHRGEHVPEMDFLGSHSQNTEMDSASIFSRNNG